METRTQTQTQSASISVSSTSTKKRKARTSVSADGDSGDDGKKRGRPRVDKQDESAADRRRTQIRMAQRAYRQRKESTLEELRKRVSELTNTVELMNKVFLDHHDRLFHTGLPDKQLEDVRETATQFETLMKCVRNPSEDCSDEVPLPSRSYRESTGSVHGGNTESIQATLEPKNVPSWIDRSAILHQQQPKQRDPTSVGLGYTLYMQETDSMDVSHDYFSPFNDTSTALVPSSKEPDQQHRSHQQQNFDVYRIEVPEYSTIPASISPPRTYSFQETTFGRRLHRAAVEQGYQLLLDPQRRPATYDRVFRLSFMSRTREKMILQMKTMLERGPHENLDQETALIHVGGAGTHYPRRDPFGNVTPKKESWHMGIVGPQTLALLENAAKDNITVDMTVDIAGFEGEWFDPYDVEGYLEEKGIFIDPVSSFAEAEVVVQSAPSSHASGTGTDSTPYSSGGSKTPPTSSSSFQRSPPPRPFDREQMYHLNGMGIDASVYNAMATVTTSSTVGFSDASTGSWMNFLQPGETMRTHMPLEPTINPGVPALNTWEGSKSTEEYLPEPSNTGVDRSAMIMARATSTTPAAGTKKTIIVDVAKFVKSEYLHFQVIVVLGSYLLTLDAVLVVSGVCLSRTPGYKRRDVDRALALASFDAF